MDCDLSAEAAEWAAQARTFANEVVRPAIRNLDTQLLPENCWSWEILEEADRRGLRQAPLPVEFGGATTSCLANVTILEEIAAADVGVADMLATHWKFAQAIEQGAGQQQRKEYLKRLAGNPRGLVAMGITEEEAGSDNLLPYDAPGAALQTSAVRVPNGYRVTGHKRYISNANRADVILVVARTDPDGPVSSSVSAFMLPADTPGVTIGTAHDKCGHRLANNADICLEDVFVSDENMLGAPGGMARAMGSGRLARTAYSAACALGIVRECYDRAVERCRVRVQGGEPVIRHQAVGAYLADLFMNVDVARTYLRHAAWIADHSDSSSTPYLSILPRLFIGERAVESAALVMELWGGAGQMRENGIEKLWRDASVWFHMDGTKIIARERMANLIRTGI